MRSGGGTIFSQTVHGDLTRNLRPPDEGGRRERRGTDHICGVLPQGTTSGKAPITRLPRGSTQCGKAAENFHFPTFLLSDRGGPGGKGTVAPMRLVWDAHASRADHQSPPDGTMRPEYTYDVEETGCGDSGKVHGGDLQFNRGGRSEVF